MRKRIMCFFALCAIMLTGCEEMTKEERSELYGSCMKEMTSKGHDYLILRICGEIKGIVHDPDCSCHNITNDE